MKEKNKYKFLHSFKGHTSAIMRIAWSLKGNFIASPSKDKTVRLWQISNFTEIKVLRATDTEPNTVAWSPDGAWFVVAYDGGFTIIFDTRTGDILRILEGHSEDVITVAVSPSGKYVASAGCSGEIIIWRALDGSLVDKTIVHRNWVLGLAWSFDSRFLASCSRDRSISVWSLITGRLKQHSTEHGHLGSVNDVKWRPHSHELASASHDGTIRFWDKDSGTEIRKHEGNTSEVNCLSFSFDGHLYATKSTDDFVHVRDCETGDILLKIDEPSSKFYFPSVAFHPSNLFLATLGDEDKTIRLWEIYPDNLLDYDSKIKSVTSVSKVSRRLRVFLCHSSGDKQKVRQLYEKLRSDDVDPWFDEQDLLPGQDWREEITRAIRTVDIVIVCLSFESINKRGYIHKEIKSALDVADEQPEGTIFIIPLKLEECSVPQRLSRWQWVNLFEIQGYERLLLALKARADEMETRRSRGGNHQEIRL